MAPEHVEAPAEATLLPESALEPAPPAPPPPPQQEHANGQALVRAKTAGSSRRGKQYKCGNCGELGHNTKTCPRRAAGADSVAPAPVIQPALVEDGMFAGVALTSPVGRTGGAPALGTPRVEPLKLEAALNAAKRRVITAENNVAAAATNEEFEEATTALDLAVSQLERIGACAKRCALVAYSLNAPHLDMTLAQPAMRENKRLRLDHEAPPPHPVHAAMASPSEEHALPSPTDPAPKAEDGYVE